MRRFPLFLLGLLGCRPTLVAEAPEEGTPVIQVSVHTANAHYAEFTVPEQVAEANALFFGAAHLEVAQASRGAFVVHREDSNLFGDGALLEVFVPMHVEVPTEKGRRFAAGSLVKHADWCQSFIMLGGGAANSHTLAHEVGHLLGLGHEDDAGNVMTTGDPHNEVSFRWNQLAVLRKNAARYATECQGGA